MEIRLEDYEFYLKPGATDMRKGSHSLALIVQYEMKLEPFAKAVFLFCGGSRRIIKAIVWDSNGWIEIIKHLECGSSFKWANTEEEAVRVEKTDLLLLLKGYDVFRRFPVLNLRYVCKLECFPYELLTILLMIESAWGFILCDGFLQMVELLPSLR